MITDQRQVRSAFVSTALFLSMGFAHSVGGAIPHYSFWSVLLWVSTFLFLSKKDLAQLTNSGLAAIVLLFQFLGHLVLSTDSVISGARMSASHFLVGVLTFAVVRYGLFSLHAIERGLAAFTPKSFTKVEIACSTCSALIESKESTFHNEYSCSTNQLRAPPVFAAN